MSTPKRAQAQQIERLQLLAENAEIQLQLYERIMAEAPPRIQKMMFAYDDLQCAMRVATESASPLRERLRYIRQANRAGKRLVR